jgi:tRNA G18 (ribose-2'-O)-methylase SpoU
MIRLIESRENATYRHLKALRQPRRARAAGLIFIEGFRQVEEALAAGLAVEQLLLTEDTQAHPRWAAIAPYWPDLSRTAECIQLSQRLFADLCATESPQGIALVVRTPLISAPTRILVIWGP